MLYRTGNAGNSVKLDKPCNGKTQYDVHHWFDAFGLIHRFNIQQPSSPSGKVSVTYNSRRTCDDLVKKIQETGNGSRVSFGQKRDPCETIFRKFKNVLLAGPQRHENICVTITADFPGLPKKLKAEDSPDIGQAGPKALVLKTDAVDMQSLHPVTLEPLGFVSYKEYHPSLKGPQLAGAHTKQCPKTGDIFNYNLALGFPAATYQIVQINSTTGEMEIIASISEREAPPAYIHSFFLSEHYVVLCIWSSKYSAGGASIPWEGSIVGGIAPFESNGKPMFYVIDRTPARRGVVAKFQAPEKFFCFHTINCWEEPNGDNPEELDIVCELCSYENSDIIQGFFFDFLLHAKPSDITPGMVPSLARYRLPKIHSGSAQKASPAVLEVDAFKNYGPELGVINAAYNTKPHRYFWSCTKRPGTMMVDGVAKFDSSDLKNPKLWSVPGHTPAEPIFVPDLNSSDEDGGALLCVVLDGIKDASYLLVLDASNLTEVARAEVDFPVTFGFHGRYVGL